MNMNKDSEMTTITDVTPRIEDDLPVSPFSSVADLAPSHTPSAKMHDGLALRSWIDNVRLQRSPHTSRAYQKEALRFRMWLEHRHGRAVRLFDRAVADDINAYLDFLSKPFPLPLPLLESYGRATQPFNGPLKPSSQAQAVIILSTMYEFFRKNPDLDHEPICKFNPFDAVKGIAAKGRIKIAEGVSQKTQKILSLELWRVVADHLDREVATQPSDPEAHRNRWVMHLLYESWIRREEAVKLKMGDFQPMPGEPSGWQLLVLGKGNKLRSVLATDDLMEALKAYRLSLGLPALPSPGESRPAIVPFRLHSKQPHAASQLVYRICTTVLKKVANELASETTPGLEAMAATLRQATTHWMRHTGASHNADAGLDSKIVMQQLGHQDVRLTLSTYYHPDRALQRAQLEAAAKKRKARQSQ